MASGEPVHRRSASRERFVAREALEDRDPCRCALRTTATDVAGRGRRENSLCGYWTDMKFSEPVRDVDVVHRGRHLGWLACIRREGEVLPVGTVGDDVTSGKT